MGPQMSRPVFLGPRIILFTANHLRSTGLPAEFNIRQTAAPGSPPVTVNDFPQAFSDQFQGLLVEGDFPNNLRFALVYQTPVSHFDRIQNNGFVSRPAIGYRRGQTRHLEGSSQVKSLSDSNRQGFTFLPYNAGALFLPGGSRD